MFETAKGLFNNAMLGLSMSGAKRLTEDEMQAIFENSSLTEEDLNTVAVLESLGFGGRSQYLYDFAQTLQSFYDPTFPLTSLSAEEISEKTGYRVYRIQEAIDAMKAYQKHIKGHLNMNSGDPEETIPPTNTTETVNLTEQKQPPQTKQSQPSNSKKPAAKKTSSNKSVQPEDLATKPFDVLAGATN